MSRDSELKALYQEALTLSEQQSKAIETDDWPLLQALLDEREGLIQRAEELLNQPTKPANKAELATLLDQLRQLDERNQEALNRKRQALQMEMEGLGRSKTALHGYLESFGNAYDPTFFDQDR